MCLLCVIIVFLESIVYFMWVPYILGWGTQKEYLTPKSFSKHTLNDHYIYKIIYLH
jgi:hypothetical protein